MYYLTKKTNVVFIAALLFIFSGCNDEFLEKGPLTEVPPKAFFKKKSDLKTYLNDYYPSFPNHRGWNAGIFDRDNNSDNSMRGGPNGRLMGNNRVPATGGGYDWGRIRSVNYLLEKIKEYKWEDSKDATAKHYVGEAYFFRAWFYFTLLKRFGDLPWIDKTLKAELKELVLGRVSRKTIVENMVKDLDKAIANMGDGKAGNSDRINKQIAQAFKARVCLYEGTWEKYHAGTPFGVSGSDGSAFINLAQKAAKAVIDSGIYSLYKGADPSKIEGDEYFSLFNRFDLSNNPEILLWAKNSREQGMTHNVNRYIIHGGGPQLTKDLVDSYLMKDGTIPDKAKKEAPGFYTPTWTARKQKIVYWSKYTKIYNFIKDRDPRLSQMINHIGTITVTQQQGVDDKILPNLGLDANNKTGFPIKKGGRNEFEEFNTGNVGTIAGIGFRYAEVLLIYAEASAELGNDAEATGAIDKLRARVGMAKLTGNIPSGSNVLAEVRRERRVELACEGFRLDDLLRWRKAHEVFAKGTRPLGVKYTGNTELEARYKKGFAYTVNVDGDKGPKDKDGKVVGREEDAKNIKLSADGYLSPYKSSLPDGYNFDKDIDYLLPINKRDITLSNGKLKQNPGWDKRAD